MNKSLNRLTEVPDAVWVVEEKLPLGLRRRGTCWAGPDGVTVRTVPGATGLDITLSSPSRLVRFIHARWRMKVPPMRLLGDHWERGYGDLAWLPLDPARAMPWYVLAFDGRRTHGFGVRTGASSLCWWQVDGEGVSLFLDVRCGGEGVQLGGRELAAATVVTRNGRPGESPFRAACAFCRSLCDNPRMPDHTVYGSNNWYYAYGNSSHTQAVDDAKRTVELAPGGANRPYMVMDDGWQANRDHAGPWDRGNDRFPDMARLAAEMRAAGARPGLWTRPLGARADDPMELCLPAARLKAPSPWQPNLRHLDPTCPEVRHRIVEDFRRIAQWGYELIKFDYTTFDICGQWGFEMKPLMSSDGWSFHDRGRTTAEAILDLYRAVREGAGDAVVIGCNTVGHLAAGIFEVQRTGDDTSGNDWERTRKMGVNTLAFRMPQHEAFFMADADCVGLTPKVPWSLNRQWLEVLAASGTPLFVSMDPTAMGRAQKAAVRQAFRLASRTQPPGEPHDWLDNVCPAVWRLGGRRKVFEWSGGAASGGVPQG